VAHPSYCEGGPFSDHPCDTGEDCVWPCAKACIGENAGRLCTSDLDCGSSGRCRRQCLGGPFDGELCSEWDDCSPPGECLPRESAICDGGVNDGMTCTEFRECPLGACSTMECVGGPRAGRDCARDFDCRAGICRGIPGCENPLCCSAVCESDPSPIGAGCCGTNWTQECADLAIKNAGSFDCFLRTGPTNAECPYAQELLPGKSTSVDLTYAYTNAPPFCCAESVAHVLYRRGAWYYFIATTSSARVSACKIDESNDDVILQVFSVGNNVNPHKACETLRSIACNDDSPYCGGPGDASACVTDLKIGATYYIVLASTQATGAGVFEVSLEPGCDVPTRGCDELRPTKAGARSEPRP